MEVQAVKTALVSTKCDLGRFIAESLKSQNFFHLEGCVLVVSAKIVAISEGNLVNLDDISFKELVKKESDEVINEVDGCFLTAKNGIVIPNAGIDLSNVPDGHAVLWPENPQKSADHIYKELVAEFGLTDFGVVIADSRITPRRAGTTGVALAWAGFEGVEDERGKSDLFGKELKLTQKAVADNLVSAALLVMGEADECTPISIIKDAPVQFTDRQMDPNTAVMESSNDLFNL